MTNQDLLALIPQLVRLERQSSAAVIEHLVEIDGRRLYLDEGCASLSIFCTERLGYSEDEAFKRVRVAGSHGVFRGSWTSSVSEPFT